MYFEMTVIHVQKISKGDSPHVTYRSKGRVIPAPFWLCNFCKVPYCMYQVTSLICQIHLLTQECPIVATVLWLLTLLLKCNTFSDLLLIQCGTIPSLDGILEVLDGINTFQNNAKIPKNAVSNDNKIQELPSTTYPL